MIFASCQCVAVVSDVTVVIAAVVYAESDLAVDGDDALVFVVSDVAVGGATVGNASAVYVDSDFAVGAAVDVPLKLLLLLMSQSVMMQMLLSLLDSVGFVFC